MNSSPDEVIEYLTELAFETRAMEKEVADICWYMRGSINWDQAWRLSNRHREIIMVRIKDNIETTEKTGLPLV